MNNQKYHKLQIKVFKSNQREEREHRQMAFKMKISQDELAGPKPILPGLYKFRLIGFKPKVAKKGDSINYNPILEAVGGAEDGRKFPYLTPLNSGVPQFIQDFVHSFGYELEDDGSGNFSIPGEFGGTMEAPGDYVGPLLGKIAEWEIGMTEYEGKPRNEVRRFICAVPNCEAIIPEVRHSKDMARKS